MSSSQALLITGGTVIDGTGAPAFQADVLVRDGRVVEVGPALTAPPETAVLDARGLEILPGFIDVHAHDDAALLQPGGCEPKIRQGVTTSVIGNCGHGCAPSVAGGALETYSAPVLGPFPAARWATFEDYLHDLRQQPLPLNVAALVPHAPLRASVMGMERRPATEREIDAMCEALDRALSAGATGLSYGLMYSPGNSAHATELTRLAEVVAAHEGIVVAHIRNEADLIVEAIDEFVRIGASAGAAVHVSHLKVTGPANVGRMPEVLARLEQHRADGVDLTTDLYPYEAGSTTIATVFPPWTADRGAASLLEALTDPRSRQRVLDELSAPWDNGAIENYFASLGPDKLVLAGFSVPENARYEGRSLSDIAQDRGEDAATSLIDLTISERGTLSVILFQTDIDGMELALAWPWTYVGSDGLPSDSGYVHPRLYGTFPRVLSQYTEPHGALARPEIIKRMTADPAARFGLADRGQIRPGMYADLVVVEPGGPFDRATFATPRRSPDGVRAVLVNGALAWEPDLTTSQPHGHLTARQPAGRTL